MVKTVGKYDIYRTLGEGSFGKVKYAVDKEGSLPVAIKILDKDKVQVANVAAIIKKEITTMKSLQHANIVAVLDVFATQSKIFIVFDFVEGQELFDIIANEGKMPEERARHFFSQIVAGIVYCHHSGVHHRHLKPENILVDSSGTVRICDFGLSALYVGDCTTSSSRIGVVSAAYGTPSYVAPEVLEGSPYEGKGADIWSMGVILFVLMAGYLPFDDPNLPSLFDKIRAAQYTFPAWFSPLTRNLTENMIIASPTMRYTVNDVNGHEWMKLPKSGVRALPANNL